MADPSTPDELPPAIALIEHPAYLEARISATESMSRMKQQLTELLEHCRSRKPARLLVDFTEAGGGYSVMDRYDIGTIGAQLFPYVRRTAALVTLQQEDPQKFALLVAQNRGLTVDRFTDREAALKWLLRDP
ncbi:MAG TPA: hypothetical protein VE981_23295 [Planctomycetota bacterium]|nr:hypothetical protein [Planctomycetota bacterium]